MTNYLCENRQNPIVPYVIKILLAMYEGWNFNSGNYLFTTDTKKIHV